MDPPPPGNKNPVSPCVTGYFFHYLHFVFGDLLFSLVFMARGQHTIEPGQGGYTQNINGFSFATVGTGQGQCVWGVLTGETEEWSKEPWGP